MENHDSRLKAQACFGFLWMTARYLHELWLWKSKLWGSWIFWFEETYADMDHVKQRVLQSGTGEVSLGSEKCWTFSCMCVYMQVCVYVSDHFFWGGALLSLEDRFLEITSAPYKEQGMDMNPCCQLSEVRWTGQNVWSSHWDLTVFTFWYNPPYLKCPSSCLSMPKAHSTL